jgi:cellulose synthase/poly-beta-1,6-N-acetylglucosamine synthase-like glycosyltransferase
MLGVRIMYNGIIYISKLNHIKSVFVLKVVGVVTECYAVPRYDIVWCAYCWSTSFFSLLPQRFWQWFFATVCTSQPNRMLSQKKKNVTMSLKIL